MELHQLTLTRAQRMALTPESRKAYDEHLFVEAAIGFGSYMTRPRSGVGSDEFSTRETSILA